VCVVCPVRAGDIVDMKELGVWEPLMVKTQTFKTAIEAGGLRGGGRGGCKLCVSMCVYVCWGWCCSLTEVATLPATAADGALMSHVYLAR